MSAPIPHDPDEEAGWHDCSGCDRTVRYEHLDDELECPDCRAHEPFPQDIEEMDKKAGLR
jgi:rubredoxin